MENAYKLLDGRKIAADMHSEIAADVSSLADEGWPLKLVSISIGESDAAKLYVRNQSRTAKKTGIDFEERDYPADTTEKELLGIIQGLNTDPRVTGIIIQRPTPDHGRQPFIGQVGCTAHEIVKKLDRLAHIPPPVFERQ